MFFFFFFHRRLILHGKLVILMDVVWLPLTIIYQIYFWMEDAYLKNDNSNPTLLS